MKAVSLPDGCSSRQAIHAIQPGEVFLMYADPQFLKPVAQVCRDSTHYYVAGPRFNGGEIKIDGFVETDMVNHYNYTEHDERNHIYRCETIQQTLEKLQYLFKINKLP